jgi:hypothetical protein
LKGLAFVAGPFAFWAVAEARNFEVGPGHASLSLDTVSAQLREGDTIRVFPGRYGSCAVLRADKVTVEGVGDAASVVLAGGICQGKAILVVAGRGVTIRNLTLAEARVPEGNGAGIRAEGGALTVDGVRFVDDQNGILTSDTARGMALLVKHSLFEHDGACVGACAHGIYAGHIALLRVTDTVFSDTQMGHAIKSRAARTEVVGCDMADGPAGTGSYLIEAPNGGAVLVQGNRLEKGPHTGNKAAIAFGTEGVDWPGSSILVTGNRFVNDGIRQLVFVRNDSGVPAELRANLVTGAITPLTGPGTVIDKNATIRPN